MLMSLHLKIRYLLFILFSLLWNQCLSNLCCSFSGRCLNQVLLPPASKSTSATPHSGQRAFSNTYTVPGTAWLVLRPWPFSPFGGDGIRPESAKQHGQYKPWVLQESQGCVHSYTCYPHGQQALKGQWSGSSTNKCSERDSGFILWKSTEFFQNALIERETSSSWDSALIYLPFAP